MTNAEALRSIASQTLTNTKMIAHVAAQIERHDHWHDEVRDLELREARDRPRQTVLAWAQVIATLAAVVSVIIVLVTAHG